VYFSDRAHQDFSPFVELDLARHFIEGRVGAHGLPALGELPAFHGGFDKR